MKKRFIILIVITAVIFVTFMLWYTEGLRAVSPTSTKPQTFIIEKGLTLRDVANKLEHDGLVRSKVAFFLYLRFSGLAQKIQAGSYRLNPGMDAKTIATNLTRGTNDIWITTLEGWRVDEIASRLSQDLGIPEHEFLRYAKEGYMFPETYLIPKNASTSAIAKLFLDTFYQKITPSMEEGIKKKGLTLSQVVTLASIVEREGINDDDRPMIAGILLKRLKPDWLLQADATLQYALGYQGDQKTWWKKDLTDEDKAIDSPYNTYKYTGIPPGPIANPGLASIKAVIYPKESPYWFYLHALNGQVYYAKTIEEHQENINKYLR